jgi:hypothetical protein
MGAPFVVANSWLFLVCPEWLGTTSRALPQYAEIMHLFPHTGKNDKRWRRPAKDSRKRDKSSHKKTFLVAVSMGA